MTEAKCRSCGAPIIWAKTMNGKRMPMDAKAEMRLVFLPTSNGPDRPVYLTDTYTSHFATCPDAAEHRRKRS